MRRMLYGGLATAVGVLAFLTGVVVAQVATAKSTASARQRHASKVNLRRAAEKILLRMDVAYDAYSGEFYSDAIPLASRRGAVRSLDGELARVVGGLGKLRIPSDDRGALNTFRETVSSTRGTLRSLSAAPNVRTFDNDLQTLNSEVTTFNNDEDALRVKLGLPKFAGQSWFRAQGPGRLVYRDSLARPHKNTNWRPMAPYSVFADGGLVLRAPAGKTTYHGPSTPYVYSGLSVAIKVDASPISGSPDFGIGCPNGPKQHSSQLVGFMSPTGTWAIGVAARTSGDQPPATYMGASGTSRAISGRGVNHLRMDCQQFAPGLAIGRLYDNGTLLGYLDAPVELAKATEPQLVDLSLAGGDSSTLFKNWSVSELRR